MGRRRDGNHFPQKNNLIQDSEENEENGYSVPDSNETKINDTKECSEAPSQEKPSKKKIL
jgi:hypothetical protein